ncbi:MAG: aminotransferase class I/II-fold pyridoxal phosphate-dependent enzyme [Candidatus Aminicenantaceae bacterium]
MACLLEPGDGVVVTEPGYPAFARVAAHRHCRVYSVPLDPAADFRVPHQLFH